MTKVMKIWTGMASHVRMRDRSLKILQYGSQMLLGYYSVRLSHAARSRLGALQGQASTARKGFWILKNLTHVDEAIRMINAGYLTSESPLTDKIDFIENLCLMWYYWTETQVFFSRAGNMFGLQEVKLDWTCNVSWFCGDLAYFASSLLKLHRHIAEKEETDRLIIAHGGTSSNAADTDDEVATRLLRSLCQQRDDQDNLTPRVRNAFFISILELAVSLRYVGGYKWLLGEKSDMGEGLCGLIGVCSSTLIMYEGCLDIMANQEEVEEENDSNKLKEE
jgi:hypothetical protein